MAEKVTWNVLEHGPIQKLNERLWRVEGAVPGMPLRRVMTVAKRADSELVIHSAIALNDDELAELEAFGTPTHLVVPNHYHRLDAPAYKQRYPALKVYAPAAVRSKVEQKIAVDRIYADFPSDEHVELYDLPGCGQLEGALLVHASDGTSVVFNDVVMNMDPRTNLMGRLMTTLMGSAPGPRVSWLAKLALVKDKAALRAELERLAALPELARMIVSHDKVANGREQAANALKQAASYL